MKKELVIALLFVFCMVGVFAMDDTITVKTSDGDHVKLYAWTAGTGPLLLMDEGNVVNGTFTTTLYSLIVPIVKFHVIVTKNDEKIRDNKFDNMKTSEPWIINCIPANCTISIFNDSIVKVIENEIVENTTAENSSLITNAEIGESKLIIIGKSIFINEDGTIKYGIISGIVAAIILIILVMIFAKRKKTIKEESAPKKDNPEEEELEQIEEKIHKNEQEIKAIKESEFRKMRLDEAKKKLQEEEQEIKSLKEKTPNNQNNQNQSFPDRASLNKPNPYAGNSTLKDRTNAQNNKHIKSFVDNMRKFANGGN